MAYFMFSILPLDHFLRVSQIVCQHFYGRKLQLFEESIKGFPNDFQSKHNISLIPRFFQETKFLISIHLKTTFIFLLSHHSCPPVCGLALLVICGFIALVFIRNLGNLLQVLSLKKDSWELISLYVEEPVETQHILC